MTDRHLLAAGLLLGCLLCTVPVMGQMPVPELSHKMTRLATPVAAPDFVLQDMDEEPHALKDYRGRVVMVNFWATWCPPCRREMPSMEALYRKFQERGFTVIAVNEWEDPELVFPYMGQLSVFPTFPVLFDREGEVSQAYQVKGLPTTFLLDRQGRIVFRAVGGRDFNHPEVEQIIRELLR
jgi:thiol-disulfide isomerase/thioredoxin